MPKENGIRTSKPQATKAAKALNNKNSSATTKSLAAGELGNRKKTTGK